MLYLKLLSAKSGKGGEKIRLTAGALCVAALLAGAPAWAAKEGGCNQNEILKCYAGEQMVVAIKDAAKLADSKGKRMLGEKFSVINRIRYNKRSKSPGGNLDIVMPGEKIVWQAGVSKWTYRREISRQDMRYGGVYRFADAESWHRGMFGLWGFLQHDALQEHARAALGGEYEGVYGRVSAAYYVPLSGWRRGRAGYKEVALGGSDISMRLNLGRKWSFRARGSRWDSSLSSGGNRTSGSFNLDYAPRSWLKFSGAWRARSRRADSWSMAAKIKIPLGGGGKRYRKRRAVDYSKKLQKPARRIKRILVREKRISE